MRVSIIDLLRGDSVGNKQGSQNSESWDSRSRFSVNGLDETSTCTAAEYATYSPEAPAVLPLRVLKRAAKQLFLDVFQPLTNSLTTNTMHVTST